MMSGPTKDGMPTTWMNAEAWANTCHICWSLDRGGVTWVGTGAGGEGEAGSAGTGAGGGVSGASGDADGSGSGSGGLGGDPWVMSPS
jgi:hypothetical protein